MTDITIAAKGLTKRFGNVVALDRLDVDVPRGAALGLLGPAGAGKSTFLRVLAGLARPTSGSLTIDGAPTGSVRSRRSLGVVLEDAPLYGWMRGREALAFAADLARVGDAKLPGRIAEIASAFGLEGALDQRISTLSTDVRGRLAIAQAIIGDPAVLLLDEPMRWADHDARAGVLRALSELRGERTILLAARRWPEVRDLCDRVAVLDAGRLVLEGATVELARRLRSVYVVETAGAPGLALAGVVARLRSEPWVTDVDATGGTLRITASDDARAARELMPAMVGAGVAVAELRREEGSFDQLVAGLSRP